MAKKKSTKQDNDHSSLVQSVERALVLLDTLAEQNSGLTLTELCELVDLHASTAYRLLATLLEHGYVRQDKRSKAYRLGFRLLRVGQAANEQLDLRDEVIGDLKALARDVQELANLVIPNGAQATYIAQANGREGRSGVQMFTQLGANVPLCCTAVGKCILAYLPEDERKQILKEENIKEYTPHTITSVLQMQDELEQVRCNGWAVDDEERELGVRCVASPVWDATDKVIAAVGISGPTGRITPDRLEGLGETVMKTAKAVSRRLGYRGDFHRCND